MAESDEDTQQELERLRAENAALKARSAKTVRLQVSAKGGVSLYGLRRFPITFYADEWEKILEMSDDVLSFIRANDGQLKRKDRDG